MQTNIWQRYLVAVYSPGRQIDKAKVNTIVNTAQSHPKAMRGKSPKQILPVEMAEGSFELSKLSIGPIVVMSGYLTKKARSMNRWLHRWFQLLDNGILRYYQNDKKIKILGEIDIGRTCYDVRQGAKNCGISFPSVAPRCCCFCFTVLKRTYYMYAPTAIEAKKWYESVHDASNVLNRRVVAGVKRRKAPEAPGKQNRQQRRSLPLNYRISMTPWDQKGKQKRYTSLQDVHRIKVSTPEDPCDYIPPVSNNVSTFSRAASVPDFLDRIGAVSPLLSPNSDIVTPLWSPPLVPTIDTATPIVAAAGRSFGSTNSLGQLDSVSSFHSRRITRTHSLTSKSPNSLKRPESLPSNIHHQPEKKQLRRVCLPPRPASIGSYPTKSCISSESRPQPKPRSYNSVEAMKVSPVHGRQLKSNLKSLSKSTEALYDSSGDYSYRPVPKPRKTKGGVENDSTTSIPKRHSKVTFADTPNIIHVSPSPSGSDESVSLSQIENTTPSKTMAVDIADLPPPRPRKDSGPPKFVPPPPPAFPKPVEVN